MTTTDVLTVPFLDLAAVNEPLRDDFERAWQAVLGHGRFVGGAEVEQLRGRVRGVLRRPSCVGVANGTDALELILARSRDRRGDEVIVPANTFVATAEAVCAAGARPVFVDVLPGHAADRPGRGRRRGDPGHRRRDGRPPLRPDGRRRDPGRRGRPSRPRADRGRRAGARGAVAPVAAPAASASRRASASIRARTSERSATAGRWSPRTRGSPRGCAGCPTTGALPTTGTATTRAGATAASTRSRPRSCRRSCRGSTSTTPDGLRR